MYIDKVERKNIRGFEDLKFNLARPDGSHAGWTVFTGDNGSGKSSLLKAIAVALTGKDTARALQPSFHRWIREGAVEQHGRIEFTIAPEKGVDEFSGGGKTAYKNFPATIIFRNGGKETTTEVIDSQKTARRGVLSKDEQAKAKQLHVWGVAVDGEEIAASDRWAGLPARNSAGDKNAD